MAFLAPHTIHLGGPHQKVDDYIASAAITPGDHIELFTDVDGHKKWRRATSSTELLPIIIALEFVPMRGITTDYAAGDQVVAAYAAVGFEWWGFIESGQDISNGEALQPNGANGTFKAPTATTATANVVRARALEAVGAVVAKTRCRMECVAA